MKTKTKNSLLLNNRFMFGAPEIVSIADSAIKLPEAQSVRPDTDTGVGADTSISGLEVQISALENRSLESILSTLPKSFISHKGDKKAPSQMIPPEDYEIIQAVMFRSKPKTFLTIAGRLRDKEITDVSGSSIYIDSHSDADGQYPFQIIQGEKTLLSGVINTAYQNVRNLE